MARKIRKPTIPTRVNSYNEIFEKLKDSISKLPDELKIRLYNYIAAATIHLPKVYNAKGCGAKFGCYNKYGPNIQSDFTVFDDLNVPDSPLNNLNIAKACVKYYFNNFKNLNEADSYDDVADAMECMLYNYSDEHFDLITEDYSDDDFDEDWY